MRDCLSTAVRESKIIARKPYVNSVFERIRMYPIKVYFYTTRREKLLRDAALNYEISTVKSRRCHKYNFLYPVRL